MIQTDFKRQTNRCRKEVNRTNESRRQFERIMTFSSLLDAFFCLGFRLSGMTMEVLVSFTPNSSQTYYPLVPSLLHIFNEMRILFDTYFSKSFFPISLSTHHTHKHPQSLSSFEDICVFFIASWHYHNSLFLLNCK